MIEDKILLIKLDLRLCLVVVKRFPENTYFPEMLISEKGKYFSVFGCISKKFSENIFWCLEKKKENTNPEKHKPQPRKKSSTTTGDRDPRSRLTARSRSRLLREIAIDGMISRSLDRDLGSSSLAIDRDLATARSRSTARSRRPTLLLSRTRTLSLSLSFSGNALKGK